MRSFSLKIEKLFEVGNSFIILTLMGVPMVVMGSSCVCGPSLITFIISNLAPSDIQLQLLYQTLNIHNYISSHIVTILILILQVEQSGGVECDHTQRSLTKLQFYGELRTRTLVSKFHHTEPYQLSYAQFTSVAASLMVMLLILILNSHNNACDEYNMSQSSRLTTPSTLLSSN
jgi:hypothetical protein